MNYESHFARGCSYTISLWVWLWEPAVGAKHHHSEIPIISSRPVSSPNHQGAVLGHEESLSPSIVYNVGNEEQRVQYFFSATRDRHGNIHGFWGVGDGAKVRFNEWVCVYY